MSKNFTLIRKAFLILPLSFSTFSRFFEYTASSMVIHKPTLVLEIKGKDARYKFESATPRSDVKNTGGTLKAKEGIVLKVSPYLFIYL